MKQSNIYFGIILPIILVYVGISLLSVVLPSLQSDLNLTNVSLLWVANIYVLVRASFVFVSGKISDIISHKKGFLLGIVLFAVGSFTCALANNIDYLLFFRSIQAVGATFIFTSGMSIVGLLYPQSERGKAIAKILSTALIFTAIAPVVAGLLLQIFSWRSIFILNGIAALVSLFFIKTIQVDEKDQNKSFDWFGSIVIVVTMFIFSFSIQNNHYWGWGSIKTFIFLLLSVIGFVIFIRHESMHQAPIIDMNLFKLPNVTPCILIASLTQIFSWIMVFLGIFLQSMLHYDALHTGLAISVFIIPGVISSRLGGHLVDKYGARKPLVLGTSCMLMGMLSSLVLLKSISYMSLLPMLIFVGFGMFMVNGPIRAILLNQTQKDKYGMVNAMLNGIRGMVSAIGFAIMTAITNGVQYNFLSRGLREIIPSISNDNINILMGLVQNTISSRDLLQKYNVTLQNNISQLVYNSYFEGFIGIMVFLIFLACCIFSISFLLIKNEDSISHVRVCKS